MFVKTHVESEEIAYVWADDSTNPSYEPDPTYTFNPVLSVVFDKAHIDRLGTRPLRHPVHGPGYRR